MAKQEKFNSINNLTNSCVYVLADSLLANGDELDSNLPKFARSLHFFSSSGFLALLLIILEGKSHIFVF